MKKISLVILGFGVFTITHFISRSSWAADSGVKATSPSLTPDERKIVAEGRKNFKKKKKGSKPSKHLSDKMQDQVGLKRDPGK